MENEDRFDSIESLVSAAEKWCVQNEVLPLNGKFAGQLTVRNFHYYRSKGLVDGPQKGKYNELHFQQVICVRLLQAQGLSLDEIKEMVTGKSTPTLRALVE